MNLKLAWALIALTALAVGVTAQERKRAKVDYDNPKEGKAFVSDFAEDARVDPEEAFARIRGEIRVLRDAEIPAERFVDSEELYERKIAMYEDGEAFYSSMKRYADEDEEEEETKRPRAAAPELEPEESNLMLFIALGFLGICGLGYFISTRK